MNILDKTISSIKPIDISLIKKTKNRLNNLTKPQGSLGRLEDLAVQYVTMTGKENPSLVNKYIFTLAADHGVTEEGVSAYPKEVTKQMVLNFLKGGAGINVLARHVGAEVVVVDMGVAGKILPPKRDPAHGLLKVGLRREKFSANYFGGKNFIDKKIDYGTKNMTKGPAMTTKQALKSIKVGIEVFLEIYAKKPIDIIGIGEMGIGNTTSASTIVAAITKKDVRKITGRGTGIDDKTFKNKIRIIKKALEINKPNPSDPIDVLSKVGGFEIGGLCGVILASASRKVPVVLDGFISTAAAFIAYKLCPTSREYMIASHKSVEIGHVAMLKDMTLVPLFDLNLRLGEGTGSALGIGLIDASTKILTGMATFKGAGVSQRSS